MCDTLCWELYSHHIGNKEVDMPKTIDLAETLEKNPHIDPKQLCESMELLEALRNGGIPRRGYELVTPKGGRRAQVADNTPEDPRTIYLTRN